MTIPAGLTLAMDAQFRELSNFITPPRAGKITAIEDNGQVRVATDDPDGGDVLAWPLNGLSYAVDDVVYITFAVNNPESAIVLGSKGSDPSGGPFIRKNGDDALTGDWDIGEDRRILLEALRARDGEGVRLEDDAGGLGIFVDDGGLVAIGPGASAPNHPLHVVGGTGNSASDIPLRLDRVTPNTTGAVSSGQFAGISTGDMGDTFGPLYNFIIRDNAGVDNLIARFGAVRDGSDLHGSFVIYTANGSAAVERVRVTPAGRVGIGTSAPQGDLHITGNGGGFLVCTKTGVNATPQVIIPNGTGDVTEAAHLTFVLSDGTSGVANTFTLVHSVTMSAAITVGGSTWTVTLNANGEVSVARTAGSGTATMQFVITWI